MREADRATLATRVLDFAGHAAVEAIVFDEDSGLTRFTHNAIHQNVAHVDTSVRVRTVVDGRTGVAATNALDDVSLRATVERALGMAALAPRENDSPGLVRNERPESPPDAYDERTANATPTDRARVVAEIVAVAERSGLWAAGYVTTERSGITVANSAGTLASYDGTSCGLNVKTNGTDATGFAERYATAFSALSGTYSSARASEKALLAKAPIDVTPGEWTVILEPAAIGELLSYFTSGFSAKTFDEGSSFLAGGLGRGYANSDVTISDDFAHPLLAGQPFDFEGYATQRTPLLERGVANKLVTDAAWARRLNRDNTGHGLPAPNADGPMASHVVVAGGSKTTAELIAETKRGLLVTRFWYIRPVDERKTIVTGMTRDGTFLIENGEVVSGVRNMRFNQSILEALETASFSSDPVRTEGYSYKMVVPTTKFESFRFTSTTDF